MTMSIEEIYRDTDRTFYKIERFSKTPSSIESFVYAIDVNMVKVKRPVSAPKPRRQPATILLA
jgi:hypothetical protein